MYSFIELSSHFSQILIIVLIDMLHLKLINKLPDFNSKRIMIVLIIPNCINVGNSPNKNLGYLKLINYLVVMTPNVLSLSRRFFIIATVCDWNKCNGIVCPGTRMTLGNVIIGRVIQASSSWIVRPRTSSRSSPKY